MSANVFVRPNVLCTRIYAEDAKTALEEADPEEIARRVSYWELLDLTNIKPLLYSSTLLQRENLTPRQRSELDAFVRPGTRGLWPTEWPFNPMPSVNGITPFFERGLVADAAKEVGPIVARRPPRGDSTSRQSAATTPPKRDRQAEVINAPPEATMIVLAPPGTGKTYALVERLCHLIRHGKIESPSQAVLVLSFTRSAVGELTRRVVERTGQGSEDDLRYISIRTFDSFATTMLLKDSDPEELSALSYERRIREFTRRLKAREGSEANAEIGRLRWLLVDEVQDVSDVRAEMVLQLIRRIKENRGAVLLLGDPAQAIYDWGISEGGMRSDDFLQQARELLLPEVQQVEFVDYHRYSDQLRPLVLRARGLVGQNGRETSGPALITLLREAGAPKTLEDLKGCAKGKETSAALTRTNLEAFQLFEWCRTHGVPAIQRRGSGGEYWPGWLGRLTYRFKQEKMSVALAKERWDRFIGERARESWADAIEFLHEQRLVTKDTIDLFRLSRRVLERGPIRAAARPGSGQLVISTVHRSKGMEFDAVFLLEPVREISGNPEEVRVLYVAGTRARSRLHILKRDRTTFPFGRKSKPDIHHFLRYKDSTNHMLLEGLEELDPESIILGPEGIGRPTELIQQAQEAIWSRCSPGSTELTARAEGQSYHLIVNDEVEGTTASLNICGLSETLIDDLRTVGRYFGKSFNAITRLKVVDLATVAFPPDNTLAREALGEARLALLPVIQGEAILEG